MPVLTDIKRQLELNDTSWDAILGDIISKVFSAADSAMSLNHSLVTGYTQYWDGGIKTLYFDYVNIRDYVVTDDDVAMVQGRDEDYVIYPERGYMKSVGATFTEGYRIIKAVYNAGYGEDDYPMDLRSALIKQIIHEFRRRKDSGLTSVTYPDGSVSKMIIDEWLPDVEKILIKKGRTWL